eukprot:5265771-Pleurochrysis_carterae.AAC.1
MHISVPPVFLSECRQTLNCCLRSVTGGNYRYKNQYTIKRVQLPVHSSFDFTLFDAGNDGLFVGGFYEATHAPTHPRSTSTHAHAHAQTHAHA